MPKAIVTPATARACSGLPDGSSTCSQVTIGRGRGRRRAGSTQLSAARRELAQPPAPAQPVSCCGG
eukprot:366282-Chlamydomonas_euryale.AAC.14